MPIEALLEAIWQKVREGAGISAVRDLYHICLEAIKTDVPLALEYLVPLSEETERRLASAPDSEIKELYSLHLRILLAAAPHHFESYLLYIEHLRPLNKRFYEPRRKVLKPLVEDLQDLEDGKIDFLGVSLPPRVGKSTLCIFFMSFHIGRNPDSANVVSGHSDPLTSGFYRRILAIIDNPAQYPWREVFPNAGKIETKADVHTINLQGEGFETLTCRPIGGTLTGAVEVSEEGILYSDDLVRDLQESLSPERLQAKYDAYLNQLKDRKKDGAKELMVGTRWNVMDPLGRIQEQYRDNPRYRFRVIPALDENGESNFRYRTKSFSTKYFQDIKASIDDATWAAKYMGKPYIREGLLFPEGGLKYYNGVLPDGEPVKYAVCDVAWGGGDSLSMPIAYVYGSDVYITDVVFNRGDKTVTYPLVEAKLARHLPNKNRFEANNGGEEYADKVDEDLRRAGIRLNIVSLRSPSTVSKMTRIIQYAPEIKEFYFLAEKYRSPEYKAFMRELTTFVQTGKNLHDDAADSLSMLAEEIFAGGTKVTVGERLI